MSSCGTDPSSDNAWLKEELDSKHLEKKYMTYNYCNDKWRCYDQGLPKECTIEKFKMKGCIDHILILLVVLYFGINYDQELQRSITFLKENAYTMIE